MSRPGISVLLRRLQCRLQPVPNVARAWCSRTRPKRSRAMSAVPAFPRVNSSSRAPSATTITAAR
eukprot:3480301-Prymnesium_polylepis.1